jgi:hypothetical protein
MRKVFPHKLHTHHTIAPFFFSTFCISCLTATVQTALADEDLAQKLANPIAAITSLPLQINLDDNLGPNDKGTRKTINFQPVIPFSLGDEASLVTRTIVPYIDQKDVIPGTSQSGFGDILFNAWYSKTTPDKVTWGVGPTLRIPTWSDVSTDTWAGGATGIVLKVAGPWTMGALGNHIWDLESNPKVPTSASFVQPFVSYTTSSAFTYSLTSESTYDWKATEWTIPINLSLAKVLPIGGVPINWVAGAGYWATSPDNGPEGWRLRFQLQVVIPKS